MTGGSDEQVDPGLGIALEVADEALGSRLLALLRAELPGVRIIEAAQADVVITDASHAGARQTLHIGRRPSAGEDASWLPADYTPAQLRIAVEAMVAGLACRPVRPMPPTLAAPPEASFERDLTARERDVLALLIAGAANKQIARELEISVHTVKFHVASVIAKLGASGRMDAVSKALRHGRGLL